MLKQEGAKMFCKDCKANGIDVQIICKKMKDGRLSWRNADGSSHFSYNEDTQLFDHTPTVGTAQDVRFEEIEDRLGRVERQLGIIWSGE